VAPSVLEDCFRPSVINARSPRKHSGHTIRVASGSRQFAAGQGGAFNNNNNHFEPVKEEKMDTSTPKCF